MSPSTSFHQQANSVLQERTARWSLQLTHDMNIPSSQKENSSASFLTTFLPVPQQQLERRQQQRVHRRCHCRRERKRKRRRRTARKQTRQPSRRRKRRRKDCLAV